MRQIAIRLPEYLAPQEEGAPQTGAAKPLLTTFKEGVVFWLKNPGDPVAQGEAVCAVEIEKHLAELKAPAAGMMAQQLIADGDCFEPGSILGYIEAE